ncbi:MAG: N-acetyltransferase [Pyrinomonadaceae bacterium]|nr:N-acetyltransferase [Pyrinomonadaceae bacterium]
MENLIVENNESKHRFEINLEDGIAFIQYTKQGEDVYNLYHTEVPPQFGGKGVGSALAKGTLEYIKAEGSQIIPTCPFVAAYLKKHPEYQELVRK